MIVNLKELTELMQKFALRYCVITNPAYSIKGKPYEFNTMIKWRAHIDEALGLSDRIRFTQMLDRIKLEPLHPGANKMEIYNRVNAFICNLDVEINEFEHTAPNRMRFSHLAVMVNDYARMYVRKRLKEPKKNDNLDELKRKLLPFVGIRTIETIQGFIGAHSKEQLKADPHVEWLVNVCLQNLDNWILEEKRFE